MDKSLQDYAIVIRPEANGTLIAYVPAQDAVGNRRVGPGLWN